MALDFQYEILYYSMLGLIVAGILYEGSVPYMLMFYSTPMRF